MAPEDELCLLLSRGELSAEVQRRALELLALPPRWPLVLERVYAHQILPLFCRNLNQVGFPGVPEEVRAELTSAFRANALRNTILTEELDRVLRLLGGAGVPVIPLKGTALAESLYGDAALRVCADIDILVPSKRFAEAFHRLVSEGYQTDFTDPRLVDLLARYGKDCGLMRQELNWSYPLQLHAGLVWGGPTERALLEEVWAEAEPKTIHGVPAFALSPEWEFLYLAVHAARHEPASLKWLVDIDQLCGLKKLRWATIRNHAQRCGWEDVILSTLAACAALLDTQVPSIFPAMKGNIVRRLPTPDTSGLHIARDLFFSLRLLKAPSQKLLFLAVRLFVPTPADYRFLLLPSFLFFLYPLLRPIRMACFFAVWLVQAGAKGLRRHLRLREKPASVR